MRAKDLVVQVHAAPVCLVLMLTAQPCVVVLQSEINAMLITLVLLLANSFTPVSLAVYIVKEKEPEADAKRQQLLAGCSLELYWASNAFCDTLLLLVPGLLTILFCASTSQFANGGSAVWVCCALVLAYVLAVLPLTYLLTARHDSHSKAQTAVLAFLMVSGGLMSIMGFITRMVGGNKSRRMVLLYLEWFFLLSPGYCLQSGLMNIYMRKFAATKGSYYFEFWRTPALLQGQCYESNYQWRSFTPVYPFEHNCFWEWSPTCCDPAADDFVIGMRPLMYLLVETLLLWLWVLFGQQLWHWCCLRCRKVVYGSNVSDQVDGDTERYATLEESIELDAIAQPTHDVIVNQLRKVQACWLIAIHIRDLAGV